MAELAEIKNALADLLASMKTMSEESKAWHASMEKFSEERKAAEEEMIASRQNFWEEMEADREEMIANLQEISAETEINLTVENIVHCYNFEVPNVLVEHTLKESNMKVNQDVTTEGLTENSSIVDEIESGYTETTQLGPSISSLCKVKYLDSASNGSEDNKSEIRSNNTTSPEHTLGNCCDEVIVYNAVSYTHLDVYKRQQCMHST